MKKEYIAFALVVALGLGLIAYSFLGKRSQNLNSAEIENVPEQEGFNGKVHFQFTQLPKGLIAKSGNIEIKRSLIDGAAPMRSFENKKRDLLFAIIYKQKVAYAEKVPEQIEFSFKKISRTPSAILKQYGIPHKPSVAIKFDAFSPSKGLAYVDGEYLGKDQVDYNNFIWADYETDIFRFQLAEIDKRIKYEVIKQEAQKAGVSPTEYEEKFINSKLPKEVSDADVARYLNRYEIEDTARNRANAERTLLQKRQKRGLDYVLEKYVMDLPIQVNLVPPVYRLEAKEDWTPFWGLSDAPLKLTLFSDTRSREAKNLIESLVPILNLYQGLQLYYRPLFDPQDNRQSQTSQMHFCVWMNNQPKFWDFFIESLGDHRQQTQEHLLGIAKKLDIDVSGLKQCLASNQYKEVVDYHLQYAEYLGITTGPILYIGGEVMSGSIQPEEVEEVIQRQLRVPAAGTW